MLCVAVISVAALWLLANNTSWAGPALANTLRGIIGAERVTRLEEFSYGVADRINRWRHRNETPKARWNPPAASPVARTGPDPSGTVVNFQPSRVGPFSSKWYAPGDGDWVPIPDPRHPNEPPLMFKTLLHPDVNRSWADLFVVAVSLDYAQLHPRAGTGEPRSETPAPAVPRPGRVAPEHLPVLLAAFNGGFMAEHGHYGMRVDGVNLLKPRTKSGTLVGYSNDSIQIASWDAVRESESRMRWFRQTPACMYENNSMHVGLRYPETRLWGATLDGDTVIRRSAIGLDESRRVLFVGISNHTTARALAEGMHHAGAVDVAQLDVNWSYPKFLLYRQDEKGALVALAPVDGFEFNPGEYVSKSAFRDFFYLTRRQPPGSTPCPNCPKSK